jgi:hypothetical protein
MPLKLNLLYKNLREKCLTFRQPWPSSYNWNKTYFKFTIRSWKFSMKIIVCFHKSKIRNGLFSENKFLMQQFPSKMTQEEDSNLKQVELKKKLQIS